MVEAYPLGYGFAFAASGVGALGAALFFAYLFHICSGKNAGISTVFGNGTDGTDKILFKIKI